MQQLEPSPAPRDTKRRHCRRSKTKDQQSWHRGSSKGGRATSLSKKLPPIDPENPLL